MLKKYKKSDYCKHSLLYVKKPFYKGIYFSILFFIFIGDSILYFFSITIKTIAVAIRKISAIGIDYREELIESGNNAITIAKTRYREMRVCINILIQKLYTVRNLLRWKAPIIELRLPTFPKITLPQLHVPHIGKHVRKRGRGRPRKYAPVRVVTPFKYFLLGIVFAMLFIAVQQGYYFIKSLPNPKLIGSVNYPLSSHLYDRSGKLLYEFYRDQNRTPVRLRELPPYLASATIAIEDKDYYRHNGVALISGIVRAVKENISQGGLQGGSTITQQLVKSALLTPEKTLERKIKEIILALWAERLYTKDQILEMYLNQVAYGGASYGIEEAARTYFGKHAKDMALAEAALLAGLPQAPSLYSPYFNPKAALWRRNDVLRKMFEQGYITAEQKEAAVTIPLAVVPPQTKIKAPHFVFYVRSQLEERYGIKQVEEGGLRVVTTLDLTIQQEAEKILQEELDKIKNLNVTNGGILVTKPSTGEILAMVGSINYFSSPSGAFNVTTALRQPGSSIKPIMYSLALEKGYTAASILDDAPISYTISDIETYRPVNYDGKFHGKIPLRFALANSYNIPAVRVLNTLGVDSFVSYARNMGISTWEDSSRFGLSLTLGGGDVTMIDMATAFGVFANKGYRVNLDSILRLDSVLNGSLYALTPEKKRVVSESNAFIISDILSDNFARTWAFGTRSNLEVSGYKVSVKTGTTDSWKDNWTIGYTPEFLVAVWVGNSDGTPMNRYLVSGITGAAPIWNRVMSFMLKNYGSKDAWFEKPDDLVEKTCYFGRTEYFMKRYSSTFCDKKIYETSNPSDKPKPFN